MQSKNLKLRLNFILDDGTFTFNSDDSRLDFEYINEQIQFKDNGQDLTSYISFRQTTFDNVFLRVDSGEVVFQDQFLSDIFKIGITDNEGTITTINNLTLNPTSSLINFNAEDVNFQIEDSSINYKDTEILKFKGTGIDNKNQLIIDTGGQLQIGSGTQQTTLYDNELTGSEETKKTFITSDDTIYFYTNLQNGWQNRKTQFIDQTGKYNGTVTEQEKLKTPRTIELSGDLTGSQNFDGSQNISISQEIDPTQHNHDQEYYTKVQTINMLDNKIKIIKNIDVLSQSWTDDTGGSIGYWYYDISDSSIDQDSWVEIYFDQQSQEHITDVKEFNENYQGYVRLFQDQQPIEDLVCNIKVIN